MNRVLSGIAVVFAFLLVNLPANASQPAKKRPNELTACSFRHALCVTTTSARSATKVIDALASADRAWDVATGALALPEPGVDLETGVYRIYLADGEPTGSRTTATMSERVGGYDRATAVTFIDRDLASGCSLDTHIAMEMVRAILWRTVPGTDDVTARAESAYMARLMVPCAMGNADGIDQYQARPALALTDAHADLPPRARDVAIRGTSLFYWWLDARYGKGPGSFLLGLMALAPTRTKPDQPEWAGTPSAYDVLRANFEGGPGMGSSFNDLLLDYAVARAFVGDADDGMHLTESRTLGGAGRVHHDWDIDWPDRPRRLAAPTGVAPTGSAYVAVRVSGAPPGARLRLEAEWEEHATMKWAVVKLDALGHVKGRVAVPSYDKATQAQFSVVDLAGTETLLVVGIGTGEPYLPFEPALGRYEPHGWLLTVSPEV